MANRKRVIVSAVIAGILAACGAGLTRGLARQNAQGSTNRARIVISQALAPIDGNHVDVKLVEVNYAPGEGSEAHSHPCPVIAYVVDGAIRSQVDAGPETVYQAGETFYEPANGVHGVSANASNTAPAKLLAVFVCDHATPLTVPVPQKK